MPDRPDFPKHERAYFNDGLVQPSKAFVAWFDMMGAKNAFARSLSRAANFVAKMHDAIARATPRAGCDVVPITDGAFLISPSSLTLQRTLPLAFYRLACSFMNEDIADHRFLVRCGIAFGDVILGRDLAAGFLDPAGAVPYARQAPLGPPIGDAYEAERLAPPFGVFVHASAAVDWGLQSAGDWKWWNGEILPPGSAGKLGNEVARYLSAIKWDGKVPAIARANSYFESPS